MTCVESAASSCPQEDQAVTDNVKALDEEEERELRSAIRARHVPSDVNRLLAALDEARAQLAESERANRHEREVLSRVAEALGLAPYGGAYRVEDVMPAMATSKARLEEARAQLTNERAAHALTRARLEAAERVVEATQRVLVQPEHWEERVRQALATIVTWTR